MILGKKNNNRTPPHSPDLSCSSNANRCTRLPMRRTADTISANKYRKSFPEINRVVNKFDRVQITETKINPHDFQPRYFVENLDHVEHVKHQHEQRKPKSKHRYRSDGAVLVPYAVGRKRRC